jgi:outer membrane immunogenic protein
MHKPCASGLGLCLSTDCDPIRALPGAWSVHPKKVLVAIGVVAALLGSRAFAADLDSAPRVPQLKAATVAAPNWSGPYVGLGVGGRFSAVDANITSATAGGTAIPLPPVDPGTTNSFAFWEQNMGAMQYIDNIALRGSVYGGWNYQISPRYVVGVEADFALANERSVFHGSPYPANLQFGTPSAVPFGASFNDAFSVKTLWDGSARLRGGYLITPSTMFYLTGGVAVANIQASSGCSTVPTAAVSNCAPGNYFSGTLGPASITHSATKVGWTAGLGFDMWFWSNWVARVQYRYADFGFLSFGDSSGFNFTDTRTCTGCAAGNSPLNVSYNLRLMQHNFDFGIAYKF